MGGLQGAVRDENGRPATGAAIKIRNVDRGITVTVFSRRGNYSAPGLFPGKSEVSAGLGGHAEGSKAEIEIAPGKNTSLDLALKQSSPILTPADWIPQLPDERDVVITQFDIPTRTAIPHNLTVDPRGQVWFVERYGEKIGGLDPRTGGFKEFPIPAKVARSHGIVADDRGFVWWSESRGNHLGRLDSKTGEMKRTPLPQERSSPHTLFLANDGLIWMTQIRGNRVASFDPRTESFREYAIPTKESRPYGIVVDSRNH